VKHDAGALGVSRITNGTPNIFRVVGGQSQAWVLDRKCGANSRSRHISIVPFTPLVERHMILVDYQRSIRQICLSPYIEPALGLAFVGMTGIKADRCHCSSCAWKRYAIAHAGIRLAKILNDTFK
jgi:hypothetical protein